MDGFEGLTGAGSAGDGQTDNVGEQQQGGNPAWSGFLDVVPQELHEKVTPLLQKWDQDVQQGYQKVHSQYEPWKPIFDTGATPDQVNMALNVLNVLQDNPEYVWKSLGDYHKFGQEPEGTGSGSEQGQGEPNNQGQEFQDPRYSALEQQFNTLAQVVLSQREAEAQAKQDQELDTELTGLRKKFGDFDEDFVLAKMLNNGATGEQAVQAFKQLEQRLASQGPRPLFLGGSSGGVPGNNTDVRKMSSQDANSLAMQMLQAAAQERQNNQ